ncbi:MAG TPA: hypothetical protein VNZ58_03470 [Thermomicrobiales bacterium]|nr:hypothetical protein [Thermomicrobiales bacterium]
MRFAISYNAASRVVLPLFGVGPGKGFVDVSDDAITAKLGWSGSVTIPRDTILTVERTRIPAWLGWGVHGNMFGLIKVWAFNGSSSGGVKLTLRKSARGRVLGVPIRATTVYFSLEDPDGFVSTVRG